MMEVGGCGSAAAPIADYDHRRVAFLSHRRSRPFWAVRLPLAGRVCYEKIRWLQIHVLCNILRLQQSRLVLSEYAVHMQHVVSTQHCAALSRQKHKVMQSPNGLLMMGQFAGCLSRDAAMRLYKLQYTLCRATRPHQMARISDIRLVPFCHSAATINHSQRCHKATCDHTGIFSIKSTEVPKPYKPDSMDKISREVLGHK